MVFKLDQPVESNMFDYITDRNSTKPIQKLFIHYPYNFD